MADETTRSTDEFQTSDLDLRSTTFLHGAPPLRVDMAALSHVGRVRTNNEDHYFAGRWGRFLDVAATNLEDGQIPLRAEEVGYAMIVADGMGGEEGGEVASSMAIRTMIKLVLQMPEWLMRTENGQAQPIIDRTVERYQKIDATLRQHAERHAGLARMGTTMTMAYSIGFDLFVAHIGDSRAYLYRDGRLRQITRDQTLAQLLVDRSELTPEQAATHRLRHVLTQVLGGQSEQLRVEVEQLALAHDDWILLCSDGLSDMVPDQEIGRLIGRAPTAAACCQALIDRALELGGRDNVTAAVAHYSLPPSAEDGRSTVEL